MLPIQTSHDDLQTQCPHIRSYTPTPHIYSPTKAKDS